MNRAKTLLRRGLLLGAAVSMNLVVVADVWAKKAATSTSGGGSSTVNTTIAYFLVFLLIVLGMIVALRPAGRASGIEDATAKSFFPSLFKKKDSGE